MFLVSIASRCTGRNAWFSGTLPPDDAPGVPVVIVRHVLAYGSLPCFCKNGVALPTDVITVAFGESKPLG